MKSSISKTLRAQRTRFGRLACRLMGDRAGGVMMEYVILAVLIAAAVVALVWAFGGTLAGGLRTMTVSIFAPTTAGDQFKKEKTASDKNAETADGQSTQFQPPQKNSD